MRTIYVDKVREITVTPLSTHTHTHRETLFYTGSIDTCISMPHTTHAILTQFPVVIFPN